MRSLVRTCLAATLCVIASVALTAPTPARTTGFDLAALDQMATAGGSGGDSATAIAVDAMGNRYVVGTTAGNVTFTSATSAATMRPVDGRSVRITGHTSMMFLAKYSPSGTVQWIASASGSAGVEGYDVAVDPAGAVVVTGRFLGVAEFSSARDASTGVLLHQATVAASSKSPASSTWPQSGFRDMFIARYTTDGAVDWVTTAGNGTLYNEANGVAVDAVGNVFVTGHVWTDVAPNPKAMFRSATSSATAQLVDTNTLALNMIAWLDLFLAKYGPDGSLQWVVFTGSSWEDRSFSVAVGSDGHPVITGSYAINSNLVSARRATDGALVSTSALTLGATDWYECFVAKYHSDGTLLWANRMGASGTDWCRDVSVGRDDRVVVTGFFTNANTITSGRSALTGAVVSTATVSVASRGGTDVFVSAFTHDGTLEWVATGGTTSGDEPWSVTAASTPGFAVSARVNATPTFASATLAATGLPVDDTVLTAEPTGSSSSVIARYGVDGRLTWLTTMQATTNVSLVSLAIDTDDRLHAVGSFAGDLTSATGDATLSVTSAGTDALMVRWGRRLETTVASELPALVAPPTPLSDRTERVTDDQSSAAVAWSRHFFDPGVPVVYLANGTRGIDGVVAGRLAGLEQGPILTIAPDGPDASTLAELARLRPGRVVVVGGDVAMNPVVVAQVQAATNQAPQRIAGADRYETSARVAAVAHPGTVDVAYVATGRVMTEALSGAPAASLERAALLLVEPHRIPVVTAAELRRLRPGRIVVLGQTEAISAAVEQELLEFAPVVQRIGGVDRYETAVEVSRQRFPDGADVAFLAPGARPEDALGAVPVAIMSGGPVLFTHGHCVPATVVAELDRLDPTAIQILGSTDSVSDAVVRLERCAVSDQLTTSEPATPRSRR